MLGQRGVWGPQKGCEWRRFGDGDSRTQPQARKLPTIQALTCIAGSSKCTQVGISKGTLTLEQNTRKARVTKAGKWTQFNENCAQVRGGQSLWHRARRANDTYNNHDIPDCRRARRSVGVIGGGKGHNLWDDGAAAPKSKGARQLHKQRVQGSSS